MLVTRNKDEKHGISPVHSLYIDSQNFILDTLFGSGVTHKQNVLGASQVMVHNLGGSGGVSLRNDGENQSFVKCVP